MLTQLTINNYTTVEHLELDFKSGMTVVTGETGAGKSVMLGALGLVVGGRADSKAVRNKASRADVHAIFDLSKLPSVTRWLKDRDLYDGNDCLLRRVITSEGRSRAYINGQPAPVQELKLLGNQLIDIHSQHEQQSLLKRDSHRELLDSYAGVSALASSVAESYKGWQQSCRELQALQNGASEQHAHSQLLEYQLRELNETQLQKGELASLEIEQKRLSNSEAILQACQQAIGLCEGDPSSDGNGDSATTNNLLTLCGQTRQILEPHTELCKGLQEAVDLLASACIQIQEASYNVQSQLDAADMNPQALADIEERLSTLYQLARKHRVNPGELVVHQSDLQAEFEQLQRNDEHLEELQAEVDLQQHRYLKLAAELSDKRRPAARTLQTKVNQQLKKLNMNGCKFEVSLTSLDEQRCTAIGGEIVEFLISTIPGKDPQALAKVASGGELSRISLAIQVITASKTTTPSLVFDEVDVGIGGTVADIVGSMLRKLAAHSQIICVTHLAQVAAKGHQHLGVSKSTSRKQVATRLNVLDNDDKVNEIARMLGGMAITEQSRAHAKEMLSARH